MDEQNEKFKRDKKDLVEGCFLFYKTANSEAIAQIVPHP